MLRSKSITVAAEVVNGLAASNKGVSARGGSAINMLMHQNNNPGMPAEDYRNGNVVEQIGSMFRPAAMNMTDRHQGAKEDIANGYANRLSNAINHARNVINPIIIELLQKCEAEAARVKADVATNINIVHVVEHAIYRSETLQQYMVPYVKSRGKMENADWGMVRKLLDGLSAQEILTTMALPQEGANRQIAQMLDKEIRNDYVDEGIGFATETSPMGRRTFSDHSTLKTWLFLRGVELGQHPTIAKADMDTDMRVKLAQTVSNYGALLAGLLNRYTSMRTSNTVAINVDKQHRTVYVHDAVYMGWLERGGTSDALKCAVLEMGDANSVNRRIQGNLDDLNKKFDRIQSREQSKARSASAQEIELLVTRELRKRIAADEDDLEDKIDAQKRLGDVTRSYRYIGNKPLDEYIRYVVCEVYGDGSDAYMLLESMEAYGKENPNASADECRSHAVVRVLGKFLAGLMVIGDKREISEITGYTTMAKSTPSID